MTEESAIAVHCGDCSGLGQAVCLQAGLHVTKSEVLRAGLHALLQLSPEALQQLMMMVEKVKTGRPTK